MLNDVGFRRRIKLKTFVVMLQMAFVAPVMWLSVVTNQTCMDTIFARQSYDDKTYLARSAFQFPVLTLRWQKILDLRIRPASIIKQKHFLNRAVLSLLARYDVIAFLFMSSDHLLLPVRY